MAAAQAPQAAPAEAEVAAHTLFSAEGEEEPSPLVGVAYLAPTPDKPAFVSVGDAVKKRSNIVNH